MSNDYMIASDLTIKSESASGKAFLASNGQWYPKSQIETDGDKIISMSEWIYREKHGAIPANVVRVLSQRATASFLNPATDAPRFNPQSLAIGVYEKPDGSMYVVKPTRDTAKLDPKDQRKYASRIVEQVSNRLREDGESVTVEFQYEQGAINSLRPEMRVSLARADQLSIRYGRCILCGRFLKVAESVRRGVGPVCVKYFPALA